MARYEGWLDTEVVIDIDFERCPDALTRCNDEDWKKNLYPSITTDEQMIHMLAYNCIANGVDDASRLDGWGDVERGVITMRVAYVEHGAYDFERVS